jgi:hypothetical protein
MKKRRHTIERFGQKLLAFNNKSVPQWINVIAEIILGWLPLMTVCAVGVLLIKDGSTLGLAAPLLIAVLTWWASRKIRKVPEPVNVLRLPAIGFMLLASFL